MNICGFEIINNGMTNDEYARHTFSNPPKNEYIIQNNSIKLAFFGCIDYDKGTITVTETTYKKLVEFKSKGIENRRFNCKKLSSYLWLN